MRKSTTFGIIIIFAGYAIASYGVVLLKGWDIPWKQWINPLDPWSWANPVQPIPAGQVFPGQAALATFSTDTSGNATPIAGPASRNAAVAATGSPANAVGAAGGGYGR